MAPLAQAGSAPGGRGAMYRIRCSVSATSSTGPSASASGSPRPRAHRPRSGAPPSRTRTGAAPPHRGRRLRTPRRRDRPRRAGAPRRRGARWRTGRAFARTPPAPGRALEAAAGRTRAPRSGEDCHRNRARRPGGKRLPPQLGIEDGPPSVAASVTCAVSQRGNLPLPNVVGTPPRPAECRVIAVSTEESLSAFRLVQRSGT